MPATPEPSHGTAADAAPEGIDADAAPQVPVLVTKPKSKPKPRRGDHFPRPHGPHHDFENEVYVWMLRRCTRDMRAAQKRDEPQPTVNNMMLLRIEDVFEYGGNYIEGMGPDPAPSHRHDTFRTWLTYGWIEDSARQAAETAEAGYDPRRLLLEEEAGRRGGEKSRRGKVVTIEMVLQEQVKNLSIAQAAKVLGCSPRTVASRRAEIRAQEAGGTQERVDARTGEVLPAEGRTAPEKTEVGPLRALTGNLDVSFLAVKNEKYRHRTGRPSWRRMWLYELQ